ncbi:hypothetical protein GCM10020256_69050 [Streptomyces thermocoprophilus]
MVVGPLPDAYLAVGEAGRYLPARYPGAQDRFRRGEDEVPYGDAAGGEAAEDLVPVVLPEQCHGDDEGAAQLGEERGGRVDDEAPPDRQVLEVADLGEMFGRQQVREGAADDLRVEERAVRDQLDQFPCGGGLPRTERAVDPNDDHGSPPLLLAP